MLHFYFKAYLYIDDAHGVGILGDNSRGIIDFHNANSADVDLLMGTYSKAFASNGGFIAGKKVCIILKGITDVMFHLLLFLLSK